MAKTEHKFIDRRSSRSARLYLNEKEDLQRSIAFFFGENIEELREQTQQFKSAMLKLAIFGAFGSAALYYLLIFHT
tara:strand:+ start:160 stop:387 length:228 start_codon:yes stop_codon:yes gene_type:complete